MLPLPKGERGRGYLPVRGRGPLREPEPREPLDLEVTKSEPFVEQLADAALHGGEASSQLRERLESDGYHPDHAADLLRAGDEFARQRASRQARAEAWASYPQSAEGRIAVHNARGTRRGTLTVGQWNALVAAFGGGCAYCTARAATPTIEHVVPISRGGRTELGNVDPSCGTCNRLKRTKTAAEWLGDGYATFRARLDEATARAREVSR